MALKQLGGFETGDKSEAGSGTVTTSNLSIVTSPINGSDYALRANCTTSATGAFQILLEGSGTVASSWFQINFQYATKPASGDEIFLNIRATVGTSKLQLRLNSSGNIVAYNSVGTLLTTGATVLSANTWYSLRVRCDSSNSVGAYEVQVNGVSEFSGTANTSVTGASMIFLGKFANSNSQSVDFYYDNYAWDDASYPTAGSVVRRQDPSANGTYQTWTVGAGSGSHYQIVDAIPTDSASYLLSTGIPGDAETEALETASSAGITGTVICVKVICVGVRNLASNGSIKIRLRSNTTDNDGLAVAVGSIYTAVRGAVLNETDPATGTAWTLSGLNTLEAGAVEQGTLITSRMSYIGTMVLHVPAVAGGSTGFNPYYSRFVGRIGEGAY